jgi:hypothetical protein
MANVNRDQNCSQAPGSSVEEWKFIDKFLVESGEDLWAEEGDGTQLTEDQYFQLFMNCLAAFLQDNNDPRLQIGKDGLQGILDPVGATLDFWCTWRGVERKVPCRHRGSSRRRSARRRPI